MRQSWETMTTVSADYTDTDPTSRERELNPGHHHQESCPLLTELPRHPIVYGNEREMSKEKERGRERQREIGREERYRKRDVLYKKKIHSQTEKETER